MRIWVRKSWRGAVTRESRQMAGKPRGRVESARERGGGGGGDGDDGDIVVLILVLMVIVVVTVLMMGR
jgi:hypothetical protein